MIAGSAPPSCRMHVDVDLARIDFEEERRQRRRAGATSPR
jgi:hypothetical protein